MPTALKIQVLDTCPDCMGEAYVPVEEAEDWKGEKYMRHAPCSACGGSGKKTRWIELPEFLLYLEQVKCHHERAISLGGFHLDGGEVWDDERLVCTDCGKVL